MVSNFNDKFRNKILKDIVLEIRYCLMFLPLLQDFEAAGHYSWGSACLAWFYQQLCRASHIDTRDISRSLILLQIWIWEKFPYIAPNRLHITPHDDQLPVAPLAIWYICKITINVTIMIQLKVIFYVFFMIQFKTT